MNKKLIIILIAAAFLIGLGIGGYFYWEKIKGVVPAPSEKTLYVLWAVHVEGDTQE